MSGVRSRHCDRLAASGRNLSANRSRDVRDNYSDRFLVRAPSGPAGNLRAMDKPRSRWRSLALAGMVAFVSFAILAGSLAAQESGDTGQGWTIWQGGEKTVYKFNDQWQGEPTANGFQMKNGRSDIAHYYYGTFRVEHRARK